MKDRSLFRTLLAACVVALLLQACATSPAPAQSPMTLEAAVASPARSPNFVARDVYRHPKATLEFFGVTPQMTVVEVWPSSGWYSEILAPYLRDQGHYYAAGFALSSDDTPEWRKTMQQEYNAKLAAQPDQYGRVTVTELGPTKNWEICPPESADRVLTFRNVHNWMKGGYEQEMFAAFYRALKPGGVLGVVEHRAKRGTSIENMTKTGYISEAHVIALAKRAGFRLLARSEINANTKDQKNYPEGVWTLPPMLRLGDKNRDKYVAIGESDRMTLKFIKPDTTP
jgi:predicted methyltransferase